MDRKLPHKISDEDLLEALKSTTKDTPSQEEFSNYPVLQNDVVMFLSFYQIEPGKDTVPQKMLYDLYKLWSNNPISKVSFGIEISKFLLIHQKGPRWYYLINRSSLNLTKAAFDLVNKQTINKAKSPPWRKHFENFLNKYEIKPGDYFLESFVLYDLYDEYVYGLNKKLPLGEDQFFNLCKIYFKHKRKTSNYLTWFGVDKSITKTLTRERIKSLRRNRQLRHGKKTIQR